MSDDVPQSLTNGSDCALHWHSIDRTPTHDTFVVLQNLASITKVKTATYSVLGTDDYIIDTVGSTIKLPSAKNGRELVVIKVVAAGSTVLTPVGSDLISGASSLTKTVQWTVVKLKAIAPYGWIVL